MTKEEKCHNYRDSHTKHDKRGKKSHLTPSGLSIQLSSPTFYSQSIHFPTSSAVMLCILACFLYLSCVYWPAFFIYLHIDDAGSAGVAFYILLDGQSLIE